MERKAYAESERYSLFPLAESDREFYEELQKICISV